MKKIFYTIPFALLLAGCQLNEELHDSKDASDGQSLSSPQQELTFTYGLLTDFESLDNMWSLNEHPTDECAGPTRGNDWDDGGAWRTLHTQQWTLTNPRIISSYNTLNKGLAYATDILGKPAATTSQKAQATFLQVFYMWNITDLFGQTVMRASNETTEQPSIYLTRDQAIDKEISLLEAEVTNLPDGTAANASIASKNAGYALLAKLYLNKAVYKATDADGKPQAGPFTFASADMQKVIDYADLAISGRSYATNYFDNFSPTNGETSPELIFTHKNTNGNSANIWKNVNMTLHYNQTPAGWNGFVTLTDLYTKFTSTDNNDPRLSSTIPGITNVFGLKGGILVGQQYKADGVTPILTRQNTPLSFTQDFSLTNSTEEKGMRVIKYLPDAANLFAFNNDWVFIRYADVILMKAEAMARMGDLSGAKALVDELRSARSAAALTGTFSLQTILDERARELYWEGHRRVDQIRFSTFLNPVQERTAIQDRHVLVYPIPLEALNAVNTLHQNPGY